MKKTTKLLTFIFLALISCVQDDDYSIPIIADCNERVLSPTKTVEDIYNATTSIATQYTEPDIIEAYVTSNDQSGNFLKKYIYKP